MKNPVYIDISAMKVLGFSFLLFLCVATATAQDGKSEWIPLFKEDLSNTIYPEGVWSMNNGVLTATEDKAIWSSKTYENFELQVEFKNAEGSNSGVFIYGDIEKWLTHSVEIQIADDYDPKWANSPKNWQCGAIFGHQAAVDTKIVRKPGKWNQYHIIAQGPQIKVYLNERLVNNINMNDFTSSTENPDGSEVPEWLEVSMAELPTKGHIGFQGKHAGKPIWFRNIKIRLLD